MSAFRKSLQSGVRLLFDGAMGTMLQARGLPPGQNPETFCLERPDVLRSIHAEYVRAGANVLTTNTFGGSRFKLPAGIDPVEFNRLMAKAAREAAEEGGGRVFVAGDVGPSGHFLRPLGELKFEDLADGYREQIRGLMRGGVGLILAETQFDIAEARAIVIAARHEGDLPVAVSMTYEAGRILTGSDVDVCTATLANMGVDLVGMNCSAGPMEMQGAIARLLEQCPVPVLVQPNAGLPELKDGATMFPLAPSPFAELTAVFARQGAQAVGGCCGTTPAHIASLASAIDGLPPAPARPQCSGIALTSRSSLLRIGATSPLCVIGERINPTGKKQLTAELQVVEFTTALRFADEQTAAGAPILDVNVGAPMVDEKALLPELVLQLVARHGVPLSIDSADKEAVGLPARELINASFLNLAAGAGLNCCIANPANTRIVEAVDAANLLLGRDPGAERFIGCCAGWKSGSGGPSPAGSGPAERSAPLGIEDAVIGGRRNEIEALVPAALTNGEEPFALVSGRLIPAINEVGAKYERKEYFLP